jgi:DUF4097 and DUF4098 domain-containing protein YvlB
MFCPRKIEIEKTNLSRSRIYFFAFFAVLAANIFSFAFEDIHIREYNGNLKTVNLNGGFSIGNVSGNCEVSANGGTVKIGIIAGDLTAITSAGDIEIEEVNGDIVAVTRAGNIFINKAHKHVYAETVLGEIVINSADSVDAKNIVGGDVKLLDISSFAKVSAAGNIVLMIRDESPGSDLCELKNTNGDTTVYLPETFGAKIEIKIPILRDSTEETHIRSDFYFSDINQWHEEGKYLNITTVINKGGPRIKFIINKGNIYLKALKSR